MGLCTQDCGKLNQTCVSLVLASLQPCRLCALLLPLANLLDMVSVLTLQKASHLSLMTHTHTHTHTHPRDQENRLFFPLHTEELVHPVELQTLQK